MNAYVSLITFWSNFISPKKVAPESRVCPRGCVEMPSFLSPAYRGVLCIICILQIYFVVLFDIAYFEKFGGFLSSAPYQKIFHPDPTCIKSEEEQPTLCSGARVFIARTCVPITSMDLADSFRSSHTNVQSHLCQLPVWSDVFCPGPSTWDGQLLCC